MSGTTAENGSGPITVVVAADAAFCRQLAVVIAGISRTCAGIPHRVFVLHDGYDAQLMARVVESAAEHVAVHWIDARSPALGMAILPTYLPTATLYRLRIDALLPPDIDRVIYLDTDVVVRESLVELWEHDLGNAMLGAVRDPVLSWAASPKNIDWNQLGVPPDMHYFNAGVLLIPLRIWRTEHISEQSLSLLSAHPFGDADQGALNAVASGNWKHLDPRWNLQDGHINTAESNAWIVESVDTLERARKNPAVIHFNKGSRRRPWQDRIAEGPQGDHSHRDLWFEDLDRTAWAGWRPDESRPSRFSGVSRRVRRAYRALVSKA